MKVLPAGRSWSVALAVLVTATGRPCAAADDDVLTIQGNSPRIVFFRDVEPTQTWTFYADHVGVHLYNPLISGFPLRISPQARGNSVCIATHGVGIGTDIPLAKLHVLQNPTEATAELVARFVVADDTIGALYINNGSATDGVFVPKIVGRSAGHNAALVNEGVIFSDSGTSPAIAFSAVKYGGGGLVNRPLAVFRNNNVAKMTIAADGSVTATSFNPSSSRSLKHDIAELDSRAAEAALRQLTPVEFVYNDDELGEKRVGFIAEDVPDLVATADRKSVPIMDVVATLTRVVKDQQQTIEDQKKWNEGLRETLAAQQNSQAEQQRTATAQQKLIDDLVRRLNALETGKSSN